MYEPTSAGNASAFVWSCPPARGGEAAARRGRPLKPERTGGVEKPFPLEIDDAFRVRLDSGVVTEAADVVHHEAVIPAKAGIHFDFSLGGAATTSLLRGVRMRNSENSLFVFTFDFDPPCPRVKMSERGSEKAKAKMDSGFRRNDGQNPKPGGGAGAGVTITSSTGFFDGSHSGGFGSKGFHVQQGRPHRQHLMTLYFLSGGSSGPLV